MLPTGVITLASSWAICLGIPPYLGGLVQVVAFIASPREFLVVLFLEEIKKSHLVPKDPSGLPYRN